MNRVLSCLLILLSSYQRIVSLGPTITEELYLLGVRDKIVGVTTYCIRPQEAKKKEKVGTVMEIGVERIVSLRPDLVIATPLTNKRQLEKLRSMGINVISFPLAKDFSFICNQFLELGRIVDRQAEAERIVLEAQRRVNEIKKDTGKVRVFVQVGSRPLYTMTGGSFINDYIELAGGINIAKGKSSGLYSREEVLKEDPDVILIVSMGIAGGREKKIWERFRHLRAVRNNRIYIIDSYKMCSPTPISFAQMLEDLVEILHEK